MALYLHCACCSRKQAHGLISGHAWGKVQLPDGVNVDHPAVMDGHVRACPGCVNKHHEWHLVALAALGITAIAL
jgi:hypothetical protein